MALNDFFEKIKNATTKSTTNVDNNISGTANDGMNLSGVNNISSARGTPKVAPVSTGPTGINTDAFNLAGTNNIRNAVGAPSVNTEKGKNFTETYNKPVNSAVVNANANQYQNTLSSVADASSKAGQRFLNSIGDTFNNFKNDVSDYFIQNKQNAQNTQAGLAYQRLEAQRQDAIDTDENNRNEIYNSITQEDYNKFFNQDGSAKDFDSSVRSLRQQIDGFNELLNSEIPDTQRVIVQGQLAQAQNQLAENEDLLKKYKAYEEKSNLDYYQSIGDEDTYNSLREAYSHKNDNMAQRFGTAMTQLVAETINEIPQALEQLKLTGQSTYATQSIDELNALHNTGQLSDDAYAEGLKYWNDALNEYRNEYNDGFSQVIKEASTQLQANTYYDASQIETFVLQAGYSTAQFLEHFAIGKAVSGLAFKDSFLTNLATENLMSQGATIEAIQAQYSAEQLLEIGSRLAGGQIATGTMSLASAVSKTNQLIEEGYSPDIAYKNGLLTGLVSYATEKVGMDRFVEMLGTPISVNALGQIIQTNLRSAMSEGLEEVVEGIVDPLVDSVTLGTDYEVNGSELLMSFALGGTSGLLMATGANVGSMINSSIQVNNLIRDMRQNRAETFNEIGRLRVNTREQYNKLANEVGTLRDWMSSMTDTQLEVANELINQAETALNEYAQKSTTMGVVFSYEIVENPTPEQNTQTIYEACESDFNQEVQTERSIDELQAQVDSDIEQLAMNEINFNNATQETLNRNGYNIDARVFNSLSEEQQNQALVAYDFAKIMGIDLNVTDYNGIRQILTNSGFSGTEAELNRMVNGTRGFVTGDGRIFINGTYTDGNNKSVPILFTLTHELTHGTESSEYYPALREIVKNLYDNGSVLDNKNNVISWEQALQNKTSDYKGVANFDAEKEVVARYVEDKLGDEKFIDDLIRYNYSLASRIWQDLKSAGNDDEVIQIRNAFEKAFNKAADNAKSVKFSLGEQAQTHTNRAVEEYGITNDPFLAGYLMPDGNYLDFSEGQGYRVQDHRNVGFVFDDYNPATDGMSQGMIRFMNEGNIRIQPESNGIDISEINEPTQSQYNSIYNYFDMLMEDGFRVDMSNGDGRNVFSIEYPPMTSPRKAINDIKQYFEDGTIPEVNNPSNYFRFSFGEKGDNSNKDSDGEKLSKAIINRFKGTKLTDDKGNLLRIYHTSPRLFTEFDPTQSANYRFGDKVVNYYSTNPTVSGSYTDDSYHQIQSSEDVDRTISNSEKWSDLQKEINKLGKEFDSFENEKAEELSDIVSSDRFRDALKQIQQDLNNYNVPKDYSLVVGAPVANANYSNQNSAVIDNLGRWLLRAMDQALVDPTGFAQNILRQYDEISDGQWNGWDVSQEFVDLFEPLFDVSQDINSIRDIYKQIQNKYQEIQAQREAIRTEQETYRQPYGKQYVGYGKSLKPYVLQSSVDSEANWDSINDLDYQIPIKEFKDITNNIVDALYSTDYEKISDLNTINRVNRFVLGNVSDDVRNYLVENPVVLANVSKTIAEVKTEARNYYPDSRIVADEVRRSLDNQRIFNSWGGNTKFDNRLETNDVVKAVLAINDYIDTPYDGVIFKNITDSGSESALGIPSDIIALFNSNQFKLIGNENPSDSSDIRFSLGDGSSKEDIRKEYKNWSNDRKPLSLEEALSFDVNGKTVQELSDVAERIRQYVIADDVERIRANEQYTLDAISDETRQALEKLDEIARTIPKTLNDNSAERKRYRVKLVQEMIDKEFKNVPRERKAWIVLGPSASGKSSFINKYLGANGGVIDSDEFKFATNEFKKYGGIMSDALHAESDELARVLKEYGIDNGFNLIFPLVGKNSQKIQNLVSELQNAGYNVNISGTVLPAEKAQYRALNRFIEDDRYLRLDYMNRIDGKPTETYNIVKEMEGVEDGGLWNTDVPKGQEFTRIEMGWGNQPEIYGRIPESENPTSRLVRVRDSRGNEQYSNNRISEQDGSFFDDQNDRFFDYGMNPARNVDILRETEAGPTSRYWNNLANSQYVSDEEAQRIKTMVENGLGAYERTSREKQETEAKKLLRNMGMEDAFKYMMNADSVATMSVDNTLGRLLQSEMRQKGLEDTDGYRELSARMQWRATMQGQALEAWKGYRDSTPEGQIVTIRSEVERIQQGLNERYGDRANNIVLNEDLIAQYLRARNDTERDSIKEQIARDVAKQIPPSALEQLNSFRHLSMLFNPRTWIKNNLANRMFGYINEGTRTVRSVMETVLSNVGGSTFENLERQAGTYNPLSPQDRALYKRFKSEYGNEFKNIDMKYSQVDAGNILLGTEFGEEVSRYRDQFTSKFLNKLSKINAKMMSDAPGMSTAYAKSMVGYLKANNLDINNMTDEQLKKAKNFAINEAKYATFNSYNKLASDIAKFSQDGSMARRVIVESFLPFKRTPLNLLRTGFRYTPVGLADSMTRQFAQLKNGNITANDWINNVAQGMTGSALMVLGMLLSQMGLFRTKDDDPDRKQYLDQELGEQEYSLNWDGASYTIDWIDPMIVPLAMGAELIKYVQRGEYSLDDAVNMVAGLADPMFETSMLSGISKNLSSYSTGTTQWWGKIAQNAVTNYVSQYIPSVLGATARTIDSTRRSTYTDKGAIDRFIKTSRNKIPGLSQLNEPYINRGGEEERNEDLGMGIAGRAVLNFLSPGYYSSKEIDEYDEEMYRLYDTTGEIDSLPSNSSKSLTFDGENYKFSPEQYTEWQRTRWSTEAEYVNQFMDSQAYKNLDDAERVATIKDIRSYAQKVAKKQFLESQGIEYNDDKQLNNAQGAMNNGIELYAYFDYLNNGGSKQAEKMAYLEQSGLSQAQKEYLWSLNGYKKSYADVYASVFGASSNSSSKNKKSSNSSKKSSSGKISLSGAGGESSAPVGSSGATALRGGTGRANMVGAQNISPISNRDEENDFVNRYLSAYTSSINRGNNISTGNASVVCPNCGNRVNPANGRCPVCGNPL